MDTKEFVNGEWVTIKAGFRVYDSWSDSIQDHSNFLLDNARYTRSGFFERCKAMDYKGAAQALQKAGYATDPQYATKLISLIDANKLWQYDMEAKMVMEDMMKRIEMLENTVVQLVNTVRVLEATPPPDWFVEEFGVDTIAGVIHDLNGDADFWRNTAVTLRLIKHKTEKNTG